MAQAIAYCDRCAKIIPPSALHGEDAIITQEVTLCPSCAQSLPPEERDRILGKGKASAPGQAERRSSRAQTRPAHAGRSGRNTAVLAAGAIAGVAIGLAVGLVVILPGGRNERPQAPPPRRATPAGAVAAPAPTPDVEAARVTIDRPPVDTVSPERAQLEEIRSLVDLDLTRYAEIRSKVRDFLGRNPAGPEAKEAGDVLAEVDARYAARAEEALKAARAEAGSLLASGRYAEAVAAVRAAGDRHAEGDWLARRGRALVAAEVDAIAKAWAESIASALRRSREALDAGRLAEARDALSAIQQWPDDSRRDADQILRQVDQREAAAAREGQRDESWLRFLDGHARASRESIARAEEHLARERGRLGELGLGDRLPPLESRLRDAKLVESLAIDGLSSASGKVRIHLGERPVSGTVVRLEKRVLTLKTILGTQVEVPVDNMRPDEIAGAAGLLRGAAADPVRAARYFVARGRFDLARAQIAALSGPAAGGLRDEVEEIEKARALSCRFELAWAAPQPADARGGPATPAGSVADFEEGTDGFDFAEAKPAGFDAASVAREVDPKDPGRDVPLRLRSGRAALKVSYARAAMATRRLSIEKPVPHADWRAWRILKASVYVPGAAGMCYGALAVSTQEGKWQAGPEFLLQSGWNLLWQEMAAVKGADDVSGVRLSLSPRGAVGEGCVYVDAVELSHASPGELVGGSLMSATLEDFESDRALTVWDAERFGGAFAREAAPSARGVSGRVSWRSAPPGHLEVHYGGAGPALPGWEKGGNARIALMLESPVAAGLKSLAVWLQDAEGELFEWSTPVALEPGEWQRAAIDLLPGAVAGSWGPKRNGRVDPPVRLAGLSLALEGGAPQTGAIFLDEIAYVPVEGDALPANLRPAALGEVLKIDVGHPNDFPNRDFQTYVNAEGFTKIAAGKKAHGGTALHTATLASGVDGRDLMPDWLDRERSLPESQVRTILPFDNYAMKWGPGGGVFVPVRGTSGVGEKSESFDLTLVPRATLGGRKIGIGMWRTHIVRSAEVLINRVTVGEGAAARSYDLNVRVDLTQFQWSCLAAYSVYVSVIEGSPITFNFTASCNGPDVVTGVGVWFMFTD